jgi:hypothetical protein
MVEQAPAAAREHDEGTAEGKRQDQSDRESGHRTAER